MKNSKPLSDFFGREIDINSKLVVARSNELQICTVIKINPIMLRVKKVGSKNSFLVYPNCTVIVDGPDVMAYLLKTPV